MKHSGTLTSGHYECDVRDSDSNKWFTCNDSNVTPLKGRPVLSSASSYVLFYMQDGKSSQDLVTNIDTYRRTSQNHVFSIDFAEFFPRMNETIESFYDIMELDEFKKVADKEEDPLKSFYNLEKQMMEHRFNDELTKNIPGDYWEKLKRIKNGNINLHIFNVLLCAVDNDIY